MQTAKHVPDLTSKRALVTGASRGIGAATAKMLASAGADVVVGYRTRETQAEAVVEEARDLGVRAFSCRADISCEDQASALVQCAVTALDGLDLFIGNAGVWPAEEVPIAQMNTDRWASTLRENLDSIFYTTRAAIRVLGDGGRIVLVSSTAGQRGEAYHADYAATKGAVISYTKSLAVELAPRGITVNCVAPGWVDTDMVRSAIDNDESGQIASGVPLGRIASADDIAGPIVFLCSSLARHITGEVLNVNGGTVLCG